MINNQWESKFVGVLANYEEVERKAVFVNRENSIQFYIKIISTEPDSFPKNNVRTVTCFADGDLNNRWGFEDDLRKSNIEREEALIDFLKDSLIIFNPYKTGNATKEFYVAKDIYLIAKKDSFLPATRLVSVPIFKEEPKDNQEAKQTREEFEMKLFNEKHIGKNTHVSIEEEDTPEMIAFRDHEENLFLYGEFESHTYAHGGFKLKPRTDINRLSLQNGNYDDEVYEWDDVLFITSTAYNELLNDLESADSIKTSTDISNKNVIDAREKDDPVIENKEKLWFSYFKELAIQENLNFTEKDLYNFHACMKTRRLVLLSGLSGIGKSRIVQLYAKALGAESNLNFIPVSPSWTDDTDLLGFPDTLNNVYRPGDSGLVNTLIKASNDPDNLFIICFDEMNLARVEHYFSQFLSVLEMEDRKILKLYNPDLEHRFYNSEQYPAQIKIGQNVLFVGTVNIDETTYHFSDKVLDRSNVIELEIKEFSELLEFGKKKEVEKLKSIREQIKEFPITTTTFNSFSNLERDMELLKSDLDLLWELHKVLQNASKKFGIGTRVVKHIDQYLKNIHEDAPFTKEEGFDLQIAQRVLTKLRGAEEVMLELVGCYDEQTKTVTGSVLIGKLDNSNYKFTRSKKVIEQKAKELCHNGFAI